MFPVSKRYHTTVYSLYQNNGMPAKLAAKKVQPPCETYPLARLAAGRTTVLPLDARHCCHATNIGAATAIEEYVPIRMPITSANEKPRRTWPPKTYNDRTVTKVSPEVSTVRLRV